MAKYRLKPNTVEAIQFTGSNHREVLDLLNAGLVAPGVLWDSPVSLLVFTNAKGPNGVFDRANPKDWIVRYSDSDKFEIFSEENFPEKFDKMHNVS